MSASIPPSMPADQEMAAAAAEASKKNKTDEEMPPATSAKDKKGDDVESIDSDDIGGSGGEENITAEERMTRAVSFKDYGNERFKQGDNVTARDKYKEGLKVLKKAEGVHGAAEIGKSLHLNLAAVHIRLGEWFEAIQSATEVIKLDPTNVKALYRRGHARSQSGYLEDARGDFVELLKYDSANADALRELAKLKTKIAEQKELQKKRFGGLFSGGGMLYEDREKELKERREREEEETRQRRLRWEKENARKKDAGESEISFEDFEKEEKKRKEEADKKAREEADQKRKEDEKRRREREGTAQAANGSKPSAAAASSSGKGEGGAGGEGGEKKGDEHDYDEEEQRIISETKKLGYCYFRKELTEEEKRLRETHHVPQRLQGTANQSRHSQPSDQSDAMDADGPPSSASAQPNDPKGVSSWNVAGTTYEEKDVTSWAMDRFRSRLEGAEVSNADDLLIQSTDPSKFVQAITQMGLDKMEDTSPDAFQAKFAQLATKMMKMTAKVTSVKDLTGEAHIAVLRGTKRFIFDFHCKLSWEAAIDERLPDIGGISIGAADKRSDEEKMVKVSGELSLPDVSSAMSAGRDWLHDAKLTYKKKPPSHHEDGVRSLLQRLQEQVKKQIEAFIDDYKKQYAS
ncbi:unnamed protein product [Vitrella brassicaformis CCMP3155]|uniref:Activator of Hsp90 ATPase AHSA1-like N-terminal domain-containing protein n=1 Tax=Vitrella brassicaformis (strain CCMP3155) TaxID=1169540 RepID=A0A0G4GB16_VITBC|nr:unnamed protein product [Vitrella brassicaformis CCMP3155]|eukprot:CEM26318.1 unnamed protein product [Vitrella brassicaformis CCMP3155]